MKLYQFLHQGQNLQRKCQIVYFLTGPSLINFCNGKVNSLFFNRALPYQFLQRKSKKFIFLTVSSLIIIFLLVEYVSGFYNYV